MVRSGIDPFAVSVSRSGKLSRLARSCTGCAGETGRDETGVAAAELAVVLLTAPTTLGVADGLREFGVALRGIEAGDGDGPRDAIRVPEGRVELGSREASPAQAGAGWDGLAARLLEEYVFDRANPVAVTTRREGESLRPPSEVFLPRFIFVEFRRAICFGGRFGFTPPQRDGRWLKVPFARKE